MAKHHGVCDCKLCQRRAYSSKKELKKLYLEGLGFITEEYRIKESRFMETDNSIVWRMFTPSYSKLDLVLVYYKPNETFEIMESKGDLY